MLYYIILYYIILYWVDLSCIILYCIVLHHIISYQAHEENKRNYDLESIPIRMRRISDYIRRNYHYQNSFSLNHYLCKLNFM